MSLDNHPLWRRPRHHLDNDSTNDHVHWIELFYDLSHVVAIFVLGNYLSHHLTLSGFFIFSLLFTVIWLAWLDISLFNSLYISTDVHHRYIMAIQIITIMMMSASILHINDKGWFFFAFSFCVNRIILSLLYWRARFIEDKKSKLPTELARNFFVCGVLLGISTVIPKPYNYYLFLLAVILGVLGYVLPRIGVMRCERFIPRLGHMAERFALLLLIVSGEGFFKLVITLSEKGIDQVPYDVFINYSIGGLAIFVLCWIYFDFVGNGKTRDTKKGTILTWAFSHLTLMLSAVMIGVALSAEVKVSFIDSYPIKYGVIGCLGLAIYLYSLLMIQNVIELRTAHRFATAKVRYFGIIIALSTLVIVPFVPSIVANLFWATALFSQIVIPVSKAYITFSKENKDKI
ncbi:low temperature requirement protein A [Vibrio alginolyticus]|nr:low temperature requirement protein A [Vibrio alginolyticus]